MPLALHDAVCLQVDPSGMEKIKSRSVSNETETCISLMENLSPSAQEKLGPLLEDLVTLPWMHLDWQAGVNIVISSGWALKGVLAYLEIVPSEEGSLCIWLE